ncbi:WD repeat-containing protein 44-like [Neltuma alba]|uniref:WD repeat-containing protein 44-like n=1 Tax=Neltuma alba TaxID=207710 RepID=UPI0010A3416E|nr:WD repeat-containing protein 44-like [Prosopis alba]
MQRRKSLTLNWDGLRDDDEDDDHFFETRERMSSAAPIDLEASSSDEDDGFEDSRMSFSANISPKRSERVKPIPVPFASLGSDYDMWIASPGSITERRKRLLLGMGLDENKEFLRITSMALDRAISEKFENDQADCSPSTPTSTSKSSPSPPHSSSSTVSSQSEVKQHRRSRKPSIIPFVLGRSRSEGDIDSFSMPKCRKEEFIGKVSKQRLTRTTSDVTFSRGGSRPCQGESRAALKGKEKPGRSPRQHGSKMTSVKSNWGLGAFFLIKNLDTGKEFIVNESSEDGMWNRLSDLQTGKKLTMEEFERHLGHSQMVKELMSRNKVARSTSDGLGYDRKLTTQHSYFSKSLRKSKRTGAALLKNIKGVASGFIGERERDEPQKSSSLSAQLSTSEQKPTKNEQWVRVRQSGKSMKELSALHLCQEFQAHEGCIWTIRFSNDGHYLASSGEDKVIHVWEVQEFEVTSMKPDEGSLTPIHPSLLGTPERNGKEEWHEKKKKGKHGSKRGSSFTIPDYVHIPETVFSFSEKPHCSFHGHSDDVLDLSWSRSQLLLSSSMDKTVRLWDMESRACLQVFTHSDYVTCVQFNPMDEDYFISGCLDAKVRIWNIPQRFVVDWIDAHEMVTAISYTPDAQAAFVGTHKGSCRMYSTEDCKLSQIGTVELRRKKKSHLRKVTGFQFAPSNPSEVLVTSADSRIRIVEDSRVVHKFVGFRNANSQISASFSPDGRYVISASEDSNVYVWKNEGHAKARNLILTQSHEQFQCRDVAIAIPWPRTIKGDPPVGPALHSKRHTKHSSAPPAPSCGSPHHHSNNNNKPTFLPPLPKKKNNHNHGSDTASPSREEEPSAISRTLSGIGGISFTHSGSKSRWSPFSRKSSNNGHHAMEEEDPGAISRTSSGLGDSFSSSESASMRYCDSPSSMSASGRSPSASWSMQFDNGLANSSSHASAWGLVIVTAGFGGEIRCYQNFGLPRKV